MSEERLKRAGNMNIDPDEIMFYTPEEYSMMYNDDQEIREIIDRLAVLEPQLKAAVATVKQDLENVDTIKDRHLREEFIREELNYDTVLMHKLKAEHAQLKAKLKGLLANSNDDLEKGR